MTKPIPKPKGRTFKVWVTLSRSGVPLEVSRGRLAVYKSARWAKTHWHGVPVVTADITVTGTLTLTAPSPRRSGRSRK